MSEVSKCVLVEWYQFKGQCPIKRCKFNTSKLKTGCLALERRDTAGKKLLTDRELRYYKFDNETHVNNISTHRKKVLANTKRIITLYYYIQYILNNCKIQQIECGPNAEKLLHEFPLKLKKLNMTSTLLANMLIESNFEQYKKSARPEEDYKIYDLLLIPHKKWVQLNIETS